VIESKPRGGTSALLESEVRAREQCTSAAVNRGELEIVLPIDYEILGKCTYVRKKQDGVSSPKSPPAARPTAGHPVMKLSVVGTIYLRKREESSLLVMNPPSVLIDTYVHQRKYLLYQ
jgi:hypothetical protein